MRIRVFWFAWEVRALRKQAERNEETTAYVFEFSQHFDLNGDGMNINLHQARSRKKEDTAISDASESLMFHARYFISMFFLYDDDRGQTFARTSLPIRGSPRIV